MIEKLPIVNPSPLEEANPQSMQMLFSMDPLQMTDDEHVPQIVAELRKMRGTWLIAETKSKAAGGKKKTAAPVGLTLDMLGLGKS